MAGAAPAAKQRVSAERQADEEERRKGLQLDRKHRQAL